MKKEATPGVIAAAILIVVLVLAIVGWKVLSPAPQQTDGKAALQRKNKKDGG